MIHNGAKMWHVNPRLTRALPDFQMIALTTLFGVKLSDDRVSHKVSQWNVLEKWCLLTGLRSRFAKALFISL